MFIPYSFIKYVVTFNLVYWPLHWLGAPDGVAFTFGFLTWVPTWWWFRRLRHRRFYEQQALQQMATDSRPVSEPLH